MTAAGSNPIVGEIEPAGTKRAGRACAADPAPCGVCDICLAARKRAKSAEAPLDEEILRQLDAEPLAVKELAARFRCDAERVLEAVERLQHAGKISTAESGKLAINR